jgi:hypothetical protein
MERADNRQKSMAALGILAVVYTVVVMAVPFTKNSVFWVSYLFTLAAIVGQAAVWKYAWNSDNSLRSKFYGLPVIVVGTVYLVVQLVAGILFMLVAKWIPSWIPVVLYVIALGGMLIGCIAADITRNEAERIEEEQIRDTSFMKQMYAEVSVLSVPDSEKELSHTLETLKDILKYSDPVSAEALEGVEEKMRQTLRLLQTALTEKVYEKAGEYTEQLIEEAKARNAQCKINKKQIH